MARAWWLALCAAVTVVQAAPAQEPAWGFRWQAGEVLSYKAEHVTAVAETVGGNKVQTSVKLTLVKRWRVLNVDVHGVATLELSLGAMRNEQQRPSGEIVLFDSSQPDKSTPELREQLSKYIGVPLAVIRVNAWGKVTEVKQGSAARYECEPPFALTLPAIAPVVGQAWERTYHITLEPPQGTGEQYDALQKYVCQGMTGGLATVALTTEIKTLPANLLDRVPLLQRQVDGQVVFDVNHGRLHQARLRIDKILEGHQGPGSSYRFESLYTETYLPNP
jgi:hypothetical protein